MKNSTKNKWFWVWLVQMTVPKESQKNLNANVEVWKNLIIIQAANGEDALTKALKKGSEEEGDCDDTLRLNGKPATTEFLGVEDIGLIHDELEDGAEILWRLRKCRQTSARKLVKSKKTLLADLRKELAPIL